ncbi:hypothetical protein EJV47_22610 [Hymenobacter gummosus]|uniref:Uncharacterized protein n=1 Tax=Hymenobacter gummosus TaxID=1776032 RepID=A0A3S0H210_9BACT|nr:hypothetical protein [Hymenobacter gummosus]RTQ46320.1 hypothetical protein EJV47_22610 [Hymenobacter gummosus]
MSYFPKSTDKTPKQHSDGRPDAPKPPRRAPNDFLDYNHGPDSYQTDAPARRPSRSWSGPDTPRDRGRP